jgi:hypothetical protein
LRAAAVAVTVTTALVAISVAAIAYTKTFLGHTALMRLKSETRQEITFRSFSAWACQ